MAAVPLCKILLHGFNGPNPFPITGKCSWAHIQITYRRIRFQPMTNALFGIDELTIPNLSKLILSHGFVLVKLGKIAGEQN